MSSGQTGGPHFEEDSAIEEKLISVPIGASWSAQRQALQPQLSVSNAESTLHPLLVHDVQLQLIGYLRKMQRSHDKYGQLLKYYIPSEAAVESQSRAVLSKHANK